MATSRRSRFIMVNGIKTHYTESGDNGRVIVGMHGGGAGSSGEAGLGRLLDILGEKYRIIGLDSIGGYGQTDAVPLRYGLQSRVDHLAAFVDTLCLDTFTIMGNSQGAWCAARYAIQHPDRIENVVLLSSGSIGAAMGIERRPSEGQKLMAAYDGTRPAMVNLMKGLTARAEVVTDALVDLRQTAATRPGAREAFKTSEQAIRAVRDNPVLAAEFDMRVTLPALAKMKPTTFVWGDADIFAPPELGKQLEGMLPDITFHWIQNAGHQVQTDQPEQVAAIVDNLIRRKVPAGAR